MLRYGTTIVLLFATLIGPCLCCCAAATFFTQPTLTTTTAAQAQPSEPEEFACPYCRQASKSTPTPEPTKPAPAKPSHDCPCCADRGTPTAIAEVPSQLVLEMPVLALLPVDTEPALPLSRTVAVEYPPGLGTDQFLMDFCHRLRC